MKVYLEDGDHNTFTPFVETFDYVYSHGWLEKQVGYDIVNLPEGMDERNLDNGIYEVIAVKPDGDEIPSFLYFWRDEQGNQHGLVCAANDSDAQSYANRNFEMKCRYI